MKLGRVYSIKVNGIIRYIGVSVDTKKRFKQHIRDFNKKDKYLYKMMRESGLEATEMVFDNITDDMKIIDARRFEAKLILDDYFNCKDLWQSAPYSFKYF